MSLNSFGHMYKVTTWGESHGPSLGATIDGCPPGIEINQNKLQSWLDKRKPAQSQYTTQRNEPDQVAILPGAFQGISTGTHIHLMTNNNYQRTQDHNEIDANFRTSHAAIHQCQKSVMRD